MSSPPRYAPFLVLLLGLLLYAPSLGNGFTFDDNLFARARPDRGSNPMVAELQPLDRYFTTPMGYGATEATRGFRPVTVLSYALVHAASGEDRDPAWPHHLVNVLLYVLAIHVVHRLLVGCGLSGWPSLLGTTAFAVLPVHSDVVASIVGRGELLPDRDAGER